jgi:CubicO group peptidase (beta-lactamase class C family)
VRSAERAVFAAALACALHGVVAAAAEPAPTPWPTAGWQTSTPEAQGIASAALADLVDFGTANDIDSLLVVRHGRIVAEAYYAPFRPGLRHSVNSVTKAVVATLTGIASKSGDVRSLDEPVLDSFAFRTIDHLDADKQAMTIEQLLDSTSGLDWQEPLTDAPPTSMLQMEQSRDWVGFVLDRPMAERPGTTFNYDSGAWHLMSAILAKKTGMDTLDYAKRSLFEPLGISDVRWRADPQGVRIGGYGLFLQPRDMARIGYLYLHRGEWDGRPLLPGGWADRVFNASVDMRLSASVRFRYARGWWSIPDRHVVMAVGFLRQLIMVFPDLDVVAVVTGRGNYPFLPLIDRIAAAAASRVPLPADEAGVARLAERVRAVSVEEPTSVGPASPLAAEVSGRTWMFAANPYGVRSLRLDLAAGEPRYEVLRERGPGVPSRFGGPIGLDGFFRTHDDETGLPMAVKGRWLNDHVFEIVSRSISEGVVTTATLDFRGREVDLAFATNQGFATRLTGRAGD